jgi:hypothetical protein
MFVACQVCELRLVPYPKARPRRFSASEAQAFYTMLRGGWGDANSPFWRAFNSFSPPASAPIHLLQIVSFAGGRLASGQHHERTGQNA